MASTWRQSLTALVVGMLLGLAFLVSATAAAAADPCAGYDLCVHLAVAPPMISFATGSGTVASVPAGISCSYTGDKPFAGTCDHYFRLLFASPLTVTLTATPAYGNRAFCGSGTLSRSACTWSRTYQASATDTATIEFSDTYNISVEPSDNVSTVSSSPGGMTCAALMGPLVCEMATTYDVALSLTAPGQRAGLRRVDGRAVRWRSRRVQLSRDRRHRPDRGLRCWARADPDAGSDGHADTDPDGSPDRQPGLECAAVGPTHDRAGRVRPARHAPRHRDAQHSWASGHDRDRHDADKQPHSRRWLGACGSRWWTWRRAAGRAGSRA